MGSAVVVVPLARVAGMTETGSTLALPSSFSNFIFSDTTYHNVTEKESRIKTFNAQAARAIFTRIAISKIVDNCLDMKTFSSYRNIDIRINEYSCTEA